MRQYGLIGYPLEHSFSKKYFSEKFAKEKINDTSYENFELEEISKFPDLLKTQPKLQGLNVTIPYKESVIRFLDGLSEDAERIGAVNTIKISSGKLKGHNTDHAGFMKSLTPLLRPHHKNALVLGTGGASKGVLYTLERLGIQYQLVSRNSSESSITYDEITTDLMDIYKLIVNTTPAGMYPNIDEAPRLPYNFINEQHLLYDLVYNPEETLFMKIGKEKGGTVKNGREMLELQAEAAWRIWNSF